MCHASLRGLRGLLLPTSTYDASLPKWHSWRLEMPTVLEPGKASSQRWHDSQRGEQKESNPYEIPEHRPPDCYFNGLSTVPYLVTRFQGSLLNYSFTKLPTYQFNYQHFDKGCEHNLPAVMLITVSCQPLAERFHCIFILLQSVSHTGKSLSSSGSEKVDWYSLSGGQPGNVPNTYYTYTPWDSILPFLGICTKETIWDVANVCVHG